MEATNDNRRGLRALAIQLRMTPACVSDCRQNRSPLHRIWERTFERARIEDTGVTGGISKLTLLATRGQAKRCGDEGQ